MFDGMNSENQSHEIFVLLIWFRQIEMKFFFENGSEWSSLYIICINNF
jgi:hypothetical protein